MAIASGDRLKRSQPENNAGMSRSRAAVRAMKQQATQVEGGPQRAQQALIALLERSIRFRHRRLAVLRLCDALESGAPVREEHRRYGLDAMPAGDLALRVRLEQATRRGPHASVDGVSRRS
jgi:hypothetical protein